MKKVSFLLCLIFFSGYVFSQTDAKTEEYISRIKDFRTAREKDGYNPDNTWFCDKEKWRTFKGLKWFPIYINYKVTAKLTVTPNESYFDAPTFNNKKTMRIRKYGMVSFKLKEQDFTLGVYQIERLANSKAGKKYLFLPFTDLTNGDETYKGGRYVDLTIPDDDTVTIEFNLAYNPDCAYDKCNICVIPAKENRLPIRVEAGEKLYDKKDKEKPEKLAGLFFEEVNIFNKNLASNFACSTAENDL